MWNKKQESVKCVLMLNICKFNVPSPLNWIGRNQTWFGSWTDLFFQGCIMTLGRASCLKCAACPAWVRGDREKEHGPAMLKSPTWGVSCWFLAEGLASGTAKPCGFLVSSEDAWGWDELEDTASLVWFWAWRSLKQDPLRTCSVDHRRVSSTRLLWLLF